MDFNFQQQQHYVFAIEDKDGQLRLDTLRYAPNGQGGNIFGVKAIDESLALYGITHYMRVTAASRQEALEKAGAQDMAAVRQLDRFRFSAAEDHYGPIQSIITLNHTYKVEFNLPGYTVGDHIRDLLPGQNYQNIGKVFSAPHPSDRNKDVKGILYTVPTWHEAVFGKQQRMKRNSAVICLSEQQTSGLEAYVISSPQEFDEFWRPQTKGLQSMPSVKKKTDFNYVLTQN